MEGMIPSDQRPENERTIMNDRDQEFLEYVVKSVVAHPEDVKIDRIVDERGVLLTLSINPEDMGYVIGRKGQTAQAIRTLLKIVGAKNNARVNLKINEPEGSERQERRPREQREESDNSYADIDTSDLDDLKI
jgi:predicted RNA-binding protein YlqC (UPF0109 family)